MPCLLGCLALSMPRLTIVLIVIFSDYIGHAFHTVFWPLMGFLFLPTTTLTWAWAINSHGSVSGGYLLALIIAVLIDLGLLRTGAAGRRAPPPDRSIPA